MGDWKEIRTSVSFKDSEILLAVVHGLFHITEHELIVAGIYILVLKFRWYDFVLGIQDMMICNSSDDNFEQ